MLHPLRVVFWASLLGAFSACGDGLSGLTGGDPDAGSGGLDGGTSDGGADASSDGSEGGECAADLANDPGNCGRCGHQCLSGGKCEKGACLPIELVAENPDAAAEILLRGFAVAGQVLYWVVQRSTQVAIQSCEIAQCSATTKLLHETAEEVRAIAADSAKLYFASYASPATVYECPTTGCAGQPKVLVTGPTFPATLALDDTNVYWSAWGAGEQLGACAKSGCAGPRNLLGPEPYFPRILLHGSHVWFSSLMPESGEGGLEGAPGIYRVSKEAVDAKPDGMLGSQGATKFSPVGLAVSNESLYFFTDRGPVNKTEGLIYKVESKLATPIATGLATPTALLLDGKNLYFATVGDGKLRRCTTTDCTTPETLATEQGFVPVDGSGAATCLVQDAVSVYWINRVAGQVMRLGK